MNKFSIYDYAAGKTGCLKFSVLLGDNSGGSTASSGKWCLFIGDGDRYSNDNSFSGDEVFTGIQWVYGESGVITTSYRNGSGWPALGSAPFSQATVYNVEIYYNNSTSAQNYSRGGIAQSISQNTQDIWVNGSLIGDGLQKALLTDDTNIDSWMFYGESSASNAANIFLDDIEYSNTLPVPTISAPVPASLSGFSTTAGTPSASQTFTISGNYLTSDLVITAPTDFEVRESGTGTYGSTVTFPPVSGTVSTKTIDVRIAASAQVGSPSGNIVCSSEGATDQNVTVSGTVEGCTGKPEAGIASASPEAGTCELSSATLSLTGTTVASGITYQWQFGIGNTWSNIGAGITNPYVILGVPATTSFRCVVTCINNSLTDTSNVVTVTINAPEGGSTVASVNPLCSGYSTTLSLTGASTTGVTYQWVSSLNDVTYDTIVDANDPTYVASPAESTYYKCKIACTVSAGLKDDSDPVLVNVYPAATIALLSGTATQTVDIGNPIADIIYTVGGSATGAGVTGLPDGVDGSFSLGTFTISGTPTESGTFPYTVTTTGSCSPGATANGTITINATGSTTWNGSSGTDWNTASNWTPAIVPGASSTVIIPDVATDPVISGAATAYNLTINAGGILTIGSAGALTVTNTMTTPPGASGLVIESGGSLIEENTGVEATVKRTISSGKWHLVSSPITSVTANTFLGDYLQSWDETKAQWVEIINPTTVLNPVIGYSLWPVDATSPGTYNFSDLLNTGNMPPIDITCSGASADNDGANLLGNPYPSYIDWDGLHETYGSVYYWNGDDYEEWNGGSGSGSRYVPPMQGFFIIATASMPDFTLSNANRCHSNASFYKSGQEIPANSIVLEAVSLGYSDKLYVTLDDATNADFDLARDAYKLLSYTDGLSELYSYTGDKKLSIDVRPSCEVIQLGFTNTQSGEYTIGMAENAGIGKAELEDTRTGNFHDLLSGTYTFNYETGEDDKRFKLHLSLVGVEEPENAPGNIYSYDNTVYVEMPANTKGDVRIYNISGQMVASKPSVTGYCSFNPGPTGIYIVKVLTDKQVLSKKVWIR
ncbi:MAG TPA: T9SS type A sorting domain-containing protein [Bacteroidales bacterium]|nr:T9SS type A sorting domain-containing protein [Bacteroidales bacterium]